MSEYEIANYSGRVIRRQASEAPRVVICIWQGRDSGWYWDDSEDHGGFDRISPMGPHDTETAAEADARAMFPGCAIEAGPPLHYRDGDEPGAGYLPEGFTLLGEGGDA